MKETRIIMGMPVTVEIVDPGVTQAALDKVFSYFTYVDEKFSTYKDTSEISQINQGRLHEDAYSEDMKTVFALSEETKRLTNGYFDIKTPNGTYDPSGLVKGWAIQKAAELLEQDGFKNFYVDAGGDIQTRGLNSRGEDWQIGIRNPFKQEYEVVKVLSGKDLAVATSGTYIRGQHIYDPHQRHEAVTDVVSLTVVGPNIYEADRFATAAFAMGESGIRFIANLPGFEGYQIDKNGQATMTGGFERYVKTHA